VLHGYECRAEPKKRDDKKNRIARLKSAERRAGKHSEGGGEQRQSLISLMEALESFCARAGVEGKKHCRDV
jgi:hypothetical protein